MDRKNLIAIIIFIMGLLVLASIVLGNAGSKFTTENDFCKDCHEDESELYNKPGISLDYPHNTNNVKCIDCHGNIGRSEVSNPSGDLKITLIFDVLGTHPIVGEDTAENDKSSNKLQCLKCHPDYLERVEDRLISPHEKGDDCTDCHTGHRRIGDSEVCNECHSLPYNTLKSEVSKHSAKECSFCHTQHGYIPSCTVCHSLFHGKSDKLSQCIECHTDGHSPNNVRLDIYGGGTVNGTVSASEKIVCVLCHSAPQKTFETTPTKHANIACIKCHRSHGEKPQCINCHVSHDETIKGGDCINCHANPHAPKRVTYPPTTPRKFCAKCHSTVEQTLVASNTKHAGLLCAQCHPVHAQIPTCKECHQTPHGHVVTDCGITCHLSAHDVWKVK